MSSRSTVAAVTVAVLSLAACQSVRTQDAPATSPPSPVAPPMATAEPSPTAIPATPVPRLPARLSYTNVSGVGRTIAITFDDGPHAKLTPELLDMLKARGIRATFYVVGQNVAEYPDIARRIVAEGHEIANHTWNHPSLTKVGAAGLASQIERTNAAILAATGVKPTTMRPPYGATNAAINRRLNEQFGLKVIMWDVDPLDWKYRNAARVQRAILDGAKPGSIILVHDIHPSSVAAMPGTLDGLLAKGFKFATVAELLAMEGTQSAPETAPPAPAPSAVTVPSVPTTSASPTGTPFLVRPYDAEPMPTPVP